MVSNENLTDLTELIVDKLKDASTVSILPKGLCNSHCSICMKIVDKNQKSLLYCQCRNHIHIKCNDTSPAEYGSPRTTTNCNCISCTIPKYSQIFPFTLETDDVLLDSNATHLPSIFELIPYLQSLSELQNPSNSCGYDTNGNAAPEIDCNYYNVQEFQYIETSAKDISLFHMNIRSLHLTLLS